jgi:hypothetical protein
MLLRSENQALKDENVQLRQVLFSLGVSEADLKSQLSHSWLNSRSNSSGHPTSLTQTFGLSIASTRDHSSSMLLSQNREHMPSHVSYIPESRKQPAGGSKDSMPSIPPPLITPLSEGPPSHVTSLTGGSSLIADAYSIAIPGPGGSSGLNAPERIQILEVVASSGQAPTPLEMYTTGSLISNIRWYRSNIHGGHLYFDPLASSQNPNTNTSQAMSASILAAQGVPENPYSMNEYCGQNQNRGNPSGS